MKKRKKNQKSEPQELRKYNVRQISTVRGLSNVNTIGIDEVDF